MGTIRDVIRNLTRGNDNDIDSVWKAWTAWPPDVFGFTSCVLEKCQLYRCVVSPPSGKKWPPEPQKWRNRRLEIPNAWMKWVNDSADKVVPPPRELADWWTEVRDDIKRCQDIPLDDLVEQDWIAACQMIEAHAVADSACAGLGVPLDRAGQTPWARYAYKCLSKLGPTGSLAHFDTSVIRVLPKMRTPQFGLSLRSMSHHAASICSAIGVKWVSAWARSLPPDGERRLSLLLVPWPPSLRESFFVPAEPAHGGIDQTHFGFFRYQPAYAFDLDRFKELVREARAQVQGLFAVVLPENALSVDEAKGIEESLGEEGVHILIIGARSEQSNVSRLSVLGAVDPVGLEQKPRLALISEQAKQHRWCLDETQIHRYGLEWSLNPHLRWWEDIALQARTVQFLCVSEWLTICHVMCEDLVRLEATAEVIRAVGPQLVIGLSADGPQLEKRWPGRYAGVLTDDPGSSVLTLTSLGMALRYAVDPRAAPGTGATEEQSRTIALWKDPVGGARELSLPARSSALLLTLCSRATREWTADGRDDGGAASQLVYVHHRGIGDANVHKDPAP